MPAHYLFGDELERTIRPVGIKKIIVSVIVGHFLLVVGFAVQITKVNDTPSIRSAHVRDLGLHFHDWTV